MSAARSGWVVAFGAAGSIALASCGGADPPPPGIATLTPDPQPYTSGGSGTQRPNGPSNGGGPAPSSGSFADPWPDTSMTEVARAVGRVTWAAMENRPWPADMPFTIASPDGQPRIAQSGEQTLTPPVRVLCFYAEVTASFVTPPPAGTPDRSLELGLLLCSGGVRVVEIDGDPPHPGVALGPGLAGLGRTAAEVLATIASGRGQELLLRESDREAVGGSALFDRAMREQVRPEQLAEVQREIAQRGQPTSFDLDDMGIIALDTRGPIGFRLDLEHGPNGFVLDGPPFVRIQRFE